MKRGLSILLAIVMFLSVFSLTNLTANAEPISGKDKIEEKLENDRQLKGEYKDGEAIVLFEDSFDVPESKAALTRKIDKASKGEYNVEEIWNFEGASEDNSLIKGLDAKTKKTATEDFDVALISSDTLSTEELITKLEDNDSIEVVQANYIRKASGIPNDKYFKKQWAFDKNVPGNTEIYNIWSKGNTGAKDKVVAVIDTGVDYSHEDLKNNMWINPKGKALKGVHGYDFVNGDNDPMDDEGHGTHCAGIIGAEGNNGKGISGVNQNLKIMALKFLDENGSGDDRGAISAYSYINEAQNLGIDIVAINNSWGGVGDGEIYKRIMDTVGAKGAISVCASGNEMLDLDNKENSEYAPAGVDSDYCITVAATNPDDSLANYSNYGKNSVDMAAPGTDILSTVPYFSFNPSIYEERSEVISSNYTDFETSNNSFGQLENIKVKINGKDDVNKRVQIIDKGQGFLSNNGLEIKVDAKKGECITVDIPYQQDKSNTDPSISAMVKANGPKPTFFNNFSFRVSWLNIFDLSEEEEVNTKSDIAYYDEDEYLFTYFDGDDDKGYWDHLFQKTEGQSSEQENRHIVIAIECGISGKHTVNVDDIGLSAPNVAEENFEQYDFQTGTSMAAPHVTGATALLTENEKIKALDLYEKVISSSRQGSFTSKVSGGKILDFSKANLLPTIKDINVSTSKKEVYITGSGFNVDASNFSVKIGTDATLEEAKVKKDISNSKKIVIDGSKWINKIVNIQVKSGASILESEGVYLVKGKKRYESLGDTYAPEISALGTNGKLLIVASSEDDSLYLLNPKSKNPQYNEAIYIDSKKIFKTTDIDEFEELKDFRFGKDLPYCEGQYYNIAEMCKTTEDDGFGDWDDWRNNTKVPSALYFDDDFIEDDSLGAYYAEYKLISMNTKTEKTKSLGELPKDFDSIGASTLASYNGKIYLIGGYDYDKRAFSKIVRVYDPKSNKWSKGKSLPKGRAGGKAIQVGNKLVYTLGYGDNTCPKNLIYSNGKWTESKQSVNFYESNTQKIQDKNYNFYTASTGLIANGILYAGTSAEGYGDTFTYNINTDQYSPTAYNFSQDIAYNEIEGTVVNDLFVGSDDYGMTHKMSTSSGLVKVTAKKVKGGSISGANKYYLPGSKVTLKPKEKKGYYKKTFKYDGKTIKAKSKTVRLTSNKKASITFGKYVTKIKATKKMDLKVGQKKKISYKVLPKSANNKKVTFKSSNKKYASVSKKGVVQAKKAGKGKKVTITIKAQDGSKKYTKIQVRIK